MPILDMLMVTRKSLRFASIHSLEK